MTRTTIKGPLVVWLVVAVLRKQVVALPKSDCPECYMVRQHYYHTNHFSVEVRHHWSYRWLDRPMSQLLHVYIGMPRELETALYSISIIPVLRPMRHRASCVGSKRGVFADAEWGSEGPFFKVVGAEISSFGGVLCAWVDGWWGCGLEHAFLRNLGFYRWHAGNGSLF